MENRTTLRPGLLVSCRTRVRGGIHYDRRDLERDHIENGERRARWETLRRISAPEEHERAEQARSKASSLIYGACMQSAFGLLCAEADEDKLMAAIAAARAVCAAHNETATMTYAEVNVLIGRIAETDQEAIAAINGELVELLARMERAVAAADVKAIREAASRAKAIGGMLSDEANLRVTNAVKQARTAARQLVKRVEKASEDAAAVVAELKVGAIEEARFAFLDLGPTEVATDEEAPDWTAVTELDIDWTPSRASQGAL